MTEDRHASEAAAGAEGPDATAAPTPAEAGPAQAPDGATAAAGREVRGTAVAPGVALGPVHLKDYDLTHAPATRIASDRVEEELNRFHRALVDARDQLQALRKQLTGRVPEDDARILDVHVTYLKDSVFISDVENQILNEQMGLEAAIAKVIADFDRIFRLVQNEALRDRAVDLRDVGLRVLRFLERERSDDEEAAGPLSDYVLVARELSIVDMFNLSNRRVLGILTEEGGLASHAAILARSMRIPTVTGISGLLESAQEGELVLVDGDRGVARFEPDEALIAEHHRELVGAGAGPSLALPAVPLGSLATRDGEAVRASAACGNLDDVDQAARVGAPSVGLYRTELLYLMGKGPPELEALRGHYTSVLERAAGMPVTFRLLDVDSRHEIAYLHPARERNPALGRSGVRALLHHEGLLRTQLEGLLSASPAGRMRLAVPFVVDCAELRRVRELLFEERVELRKAGRAFREDVPLGIVLETPAAVLGVRDLASEADFVVVGLDSLVQFLLAADRENSELTPYFESLHPFVLRALIETREVCAELGKPLSVFGASVLAPAVLPLLVGAGLRDFCLPPAQAAEFADRIRRLDAGEVHDEAEVAARGSCLADTLSVAEAHRHGWDERA